MSINMSELFAAHPPCPVPSPACLHVLTCPIPALLAENLLSEEVKKHPQVLSVTLAGKMAISGFVSVVLFEHQLHHPQ